MHFSLKDMGNLSYLLGIEVIHQPDMVHIYQYKYVHKLLCDASLSDSKPASTSMDWGKILSKFDGIPLEDPT